MKQQLELLQQNWVARLEKGQDRGYRSGSNLRAEVAGRRLAGGRKLLDLGCGAGVMGTIVGNRFEEIHGVDVSSHAVEAAGRCGMQARVWDLNQLPLPYEPQSFDAVISLSVIQYVFDPRAFACEMARLVRPGGVAMVGFPNLRTAWRLFRIAGLGRMPRVSTDPGYDGGTIHYFCRRDVEELLVAAGFDVVAREGVYTRPRALSGIGWRIPILSGVVREFFSAEVMLTGRRRAE